MITKATLYAQFGVKEYWLVDPEVDEAKVYFLEANGYVLDQAHQGSGMLISSTFAAQLDVHQLFAPLD